jgi:endonuclease IV
MPLFGAHMSIAGGCQNAVAAAKAHGCQALQLFTKSWTLADGCRLKRLSRLWTKGPKKLRTSSSPTGPTIRQTAPRLIRQRACELSTPT